MDEQVSGYAGPIVFVTTPAEKSLGFKWALGVLFQKFFPIHGFFRSISWNIIFPGTVWGVPGPKSFRIIQLTDGPGFIQLLRFFISQRAHPLAADLEDGFVFLLGAYDCGSLGDIMHH